MDATILELSTIFKKNPAFLKGKTAEFWTKFKT